jgi:2-polyprenyl-3-methyl-5-hydroxy-6-metoxy-1,4-benzoquinol methylase
MRNFTQWFAEAVCALNHDQRHRYYQISMSRYVRTLELASNYLRFDAHTSVGEVGVGILLLMLRVGAGCQVSAYGLAADAIWTSLEKMGVDCIKWDLHQGFPVRSRTHDVVFLCEVIEHLCRFPIDVLTDVKKLIKPGGYLIVTTVNFLRLSNRLRIVKGQSPLVDPFKYSSDGCYHIREFTQRELAGYIQEAGFEILQVCYWGIYEHLLARRLLQPIGWLVPSLNNYMAFVARRPLDSRG